MEQTTVELSLAERARKIKLLLMDVDGTLTNGDVCLIASPDGDSVFEMKVFSSIDGVALKLARTMGLTTGLITGRRSPAVQRRADELGIDYVYLGQATKTHAYEECLTRAGVTEAEVAYMGDDLPDIPLAKRVGLAIAVANAVPELKAVCHYVTTREGGRGAAREVVQFLLESQGVWAEAVPKALA